MTSIKIKEATVKLFVNGDELTTVRSLQLTDAAANSKSVSLIADVIALPSPDNYESWTYGTRCSFTPLGEPTGPGVTDGDRAAWRDRHKCKADARWVVCPLESDTAVWSCDAHIATFVGDAARVSTVATYETMLELCQPVYEADEVICGCSRCGLLLDADEQHVTQKHGVVCRTCFVDTHQPRYIGTHK